MTEIKRTLVKSPPELWELIDDDALIARWTDELTTDASTLEVEVCSREAGRRLYWRGKADAVSIAIELEIAERGWGTCVSIRTAGPGERADAESVVERLLDELGSASRRPFSRT
jgi:uncharacterized protein YndB with AHSA1/START domain